MGSTAPAILPAPAASSVQHLAVQGGKDAKLRLINLDNLSGENGPGHTGGEIAGSLISLPQGGEILTQPAVWVNPADHSTWVFVGNGNGISGLKLGLNGTTPVLQTEWQKTGGGSSPLIANNVLFFAGSNRLQALDPTTGAQLWQDTTIGGIHWESPVVADGTLYLTDESGKLNAYTLPLSTTVRSVVSTQQYTLANSDGSTWQTMDSINLQQSITPSVGSTAILGGNADLWTSSAGYNQDLGLWISGGTFGTGQVAAWKESGGFAGTYSPNAAYVDTVLPLVASTTYTVKLVWKSNQADPGTIWAGAGPISSAFSPTRLTTELVPAG